MLRFVSAKLAKLVKVPKINHTETTAATGRCPGNAQLMTQHAKAVTANDKVICTLFRQGITQTSGMGSSLFQ